MFVLVECFRNIWWDTKYVFLIPLSSHGLKSDSKGMVFFCCFFFFKVYFVFQCVVQALKWLTFQFINKYNP